MRAKAVGVRIDVDSINEMVDIGELAKAGAFLGYEVTIEKGDLELGEKDTIHAVRFFRRERVWAEDELVSMAVIFAMAHRLSGNDTIERIRKKLAAMEFSMDQPITDVMGIGQGPDHPGHNDH